MMLKSSPFFTIWSLPNPADYSTGCYQFRDLLIALSRFSSETADWRVFQSLQEGPEELSLDPITQMENVMALYRSHNLDGSEPLSSMFIGAGFHRNFSDDRRIDYNWRRNSSPDKLELKIEDMRYIAPVTLDRYIALCDILLTWQPPRYMWVGDRNYVYKKHGLFDGHRTVANWIAWVPQTVTPAQIPSAHLVRPHLGGTLIVTQPDFFNVRENQPAIDRANAVEYEMNEAGALPLLTDLH